MRESAGSGIREISDPEGTSEGILRLTSICPFGLLGQCQCWGRRGGVLGLFFWERELDRGRSDRLHFAFPLPLWRSEYWGRKGGGAEGLGKSGNRRGCLEG